VIELLRDSVSTYSYAYAAAALIAIGCSLVGVYVVLRRVAFVGVATAQLTSAGVAFAFLAHLPALTSAVLAALLGMSLFALGPASVRVSRDGLVGVVFAIASALSVLFVSKSSAELDQVEHIVYGSLLFSTSDHVLTLLIGLLSVVLLHALFSREFLIVSVDSDTARTLGVRTRLFDLLLYLSIGVTIALSIRTGGALLCFGLLLLPPVAGLMLGSRIATVLLASVATGLGAAALGVLASLVFDLPTGPAVVVVAGLLLVCCAVFARNRIAGAICFAALLVGGGVLGQHELERRQLISLSVSAEQVHVDVELAAHPAHVSQGERLHVDVIVRFRGDAGVAGRRLFLLVELDDQMSSVQVDGSRRRASAAVSIPTEGILPGTYLVEASLWTGPPLEPDAETELLPPGAFTVNQLRVEVD